MNHEVLERYRTKKGLTAAELSARLNRTPGWYSRIKDGQYPLPSRYIPELAEIFGVKPERLANELFATKKLESNSSLTK